MFTRLAAATPCRDAPQAATGGEDAFFVSDHGDGAVAVADGVSGWADDGVDPADYSRCA